MLAKVVETLFIGGFATIVALSAWSFLQDGPDSDRMTSGLIRALVILIGLSSAWQARKKRA